MPQVNVVHANMHWDLVCSCCVTMHGIPCMCDLIFELYRIIMDINFLSFILLCSNVCFYNTYFYVHAASWALTTVSLDGELKLANCK